MSNWDILVHLSDRGSLILVRVSQPGCIRLGLLLDRASLQRMHCVAFDNYVHWSISLGSSRSKTSLIEERSVACLRPLDCFYLTVEGCVVLSDRGALSLIKGETLGSHSTFPCCFSCLIRFKFSLLIFTLIPSSHRQTHLFLLPFVLIYLRAWILSINLQTGQ